VSQTEPTGHRKKPDEMTTDELVEEAQRLRTKLAEAASELSAFTTTLRVVLRQQSNGEGGHAR